MSGLSITVSYQRLSEDEPISVAAINAMWASMSLQLTGTINTALIPDGAITTPKLNSTVISGATQVTTAAGTDKVLIDQGGTLYYATVTQLLGVGLSFGSDPNWTASYFVYGEDTLGNKVKATVVDHAREVISGQPANANHTTVDVTADRLLFWDASGSGNRNAQMSPANMVRAVTDRWTLTGGTATAYTVADPYALATPPGLVSGLKLVIKLSLTCGAAPTLQLGAFAAKALRKGPDLAIVAGDYTAGQIIEVMYDETANGAAGAWLVLTPAVPAVALAKAWVTFDGTVTTNDISPHADSDAAADTLTSTAFSGWSHGQLCWVRGSNGAIAGLSTYVPYYARKQSANVIKLYTNKTDAVNGTGSPVNITVTGTANVLLTYLNSANILASYNVDGVIPCSNSAPYYWFYVDFTTNMGDAHYCAQITPAAVQDNDHLWGVNKYTAIGGDVGDGSGGAARTAPTASGFDLFNVDSGSGPSNRICVTIHGN